MKQKYIVLIIVVGFIAGVIGVFTSKLVFSPPKNRQTKVEVVDKITSDFPLPDSHYFNSNSIDPTKLIQIGDQSNTDPFAKSQQAH
jgi:hypothetical protein